MRVRERGRSAAPRAHLGRPFRSPPSPEARHIRGGELVDSGDWTEVSYRRRKELRKADRGNSRFKHNTFNKKRATSLSGFHTFHDDRSCFNNHVRDHYSGRSVQSRYNKDRSRARRRSRSTHRRRSCSRFSIRDRRMAVGLHSGWWQNKGERSRNESLDRWQKKDYERRYDENQFQQGVREKHDLNWACMEKQVDLGHGSGKENYGRGGYDNLGTELKRYVSFYFTNFPYQLSNFYLRKGFEVCVMLEDVFVPKKRNKRGQPFGFVKFSNVRDVSKLLSALNNVHFGHYCVRARVASFDRNERTAGQRLEKERPVLTKGNVKSAMTKSIIIDPRIATLYGNDGSHEPGVVKDNVLVKGGSGDPGAVRVGHIEVPLGARKEIVARNIGQAKEGGPTSSTLTLPEAASKKKNSQIMMRSYSTEADDVSWAQNGIVATIIDGEAVPIVQSRIMDAGFNDVVLIPMGADKVFVRSVTGVDAMVVVNNAKEFFQLIFSHWTRWDNLAQPYRRGAWVRLYGIPLQAWNVNFFKLCVVECGRFLRLDNCSVEKERLDFARILIATTELESVNKVETVLVDGTQVEVRIVEEWGFNLGEDSCLFRDDGESETSQKDHAERQDDLEVRHHVDTMVENFAKGMEEEDDIGSQENLKLSNIRVDEESENKDVGVIGDNPPALGEEYLDWNTSRASEIGDSPLSTDRQGSVSICSPADGGVSHVGVEGRVEPPFTQNRAKRGNSCPPGAKGSMLSGPWSLEWLNDINQGDAGVIFSARKRSRKGDRNGGSLKKRGQEES
ncbi:putative sulfate transporter, partial [Trifolium pratense]